MNYGLRWDYFGVVQEKNNILSNFTLPSSPSDPFTLTQVGQPGLGSLYNPDKKDFAPRVSAAWDVLGKGKTVVRAGFGMFYDLSRKTWCWAIFHTWATTFLAPHITTLAPPRFFRRSRLADRSTPEAL